MGMGLRFEPSNWRDYICIFVWDWGDSTDIISISISIKLCVYQLLPSLAISQAKSMSSPLLDKAPYLERTYMMIQVVYGNRRCISLAYHNLWITDMHLQMQLVMHVRLRLWRDTWKLRNGKERVCEWPSDWLELTRRSKGCRKHWDGATSLQARWYRLWRKQPAFSWRLASQSAAVKSIYTTWQRSFHLAYFQSSLPRGGIVLLRMGE